MAADLPMGGAAMSVKGQTTENMQGQPTRRDRELLQIVQILEAKVAELEAAKKRVLPTFIKMMLEKDDRIAELERAHDKAIADGIEIVAGRDARIEELEKRRLYLPKITTEIIDTLDGSGLSYCATNITKVLRILNPNG